MQLHLIITVAMFLSGGALNLDTDAQQMQTPDCDTEVLRVAEDWKMMYGDKTLVAGWCDDRNISDSEVQDFIAHSLPNGHPPVDTAPDRAPGPQPQSAPTVPAAGSGHRPGNNEA